MANTFLRKTERAVGTTATQVNAYAVPASTTTTLIGMTLSNILTTAITASVIHHDGVNATYLVKDAPIPAGSTLIPIGGDQKMVLETNDYIQVQSSDASSVDVIMSVLEIT